MESLIVDEVPDGFERGPDLDYDTGPSDLAKAARDEGLDDGESALTELQFRRGYQRLWRNEAGDQLVVFLYEFCDAAGAEGYVGRAIGRSVATKPDLETFEVSAIPGALGYRGTGQSGGAAMILVPSGAFVLQVLAYGASGAVTLDELTGRAERLARTQVDAVT